MPNRFSRNAIGGSPGITVGDSWQMVSKAEAESISTLGPSEGNLRSTARRRTALNRVKGSSVPAGLTDLSSMCSYRFPAGSGAAELFALIQPEPKGPTQPATTAVRLGKRMTKWEPKAESPAGAVGEIQGYSELR